MIIIKGYILSVMCISIIGSLITMLTPDGEGGGIGKNMRLCFGLCVVLVCINPIKDIIHQVNNFEIGDIMGNGDTIEDKYKDYFDSSYSAAELDDLKNGIYRLLADKYGIEREECKLSVRLSEGESQKKDIDSIFITLYGSAIFKNTDEIENYLGGLFGCEIITIIG